MTQLARPLDDVAVAISISESEEAEGLGLNSAAVSRITVQLTSALLGQGASVVFGHDWRSDGVMEAINAFAQMYEAGPEEVPVSNVVPWPDKPFLSSEIRERLAASVAIIEPGLPFDLAQRGKPDDVNDDEWSAVLRGQALTHARQMLTERTKARVCMGGRVAQYSGRIPGVLEEAFCSIEAQQPLYLVGALGGITKQLIDVCEGKTREIHIGEPPQAVAAGYTKLRGRRIPLLPVFSIDGMVETLRSGGLRVIAQRNGLSVAENEELFHTLALERTFELVAVGLSRVFRGLRS